MDLIDFMEGVPSKENEKKLEKEYYKSILGEFKKLSNAESITHSFIEVHMVRLVIDEECTDEKPPKYRIYVCGEMSGKLHKEMSDAMSNFVEEGEYAFHKRANQLEFQLPYMFGEYLNSDKKDEEYWCKLDNCGEVGAAKCCYDFIVLKFDKVGMGSVATFNGEEHPFWRELRTGWSFRNNNDSNYKLICYNELFRRSACDSDYFIYMYEGTLNSLSALKYEGEPNHGTVLALGTFKKDDFEKEKCNFDASIIFKEPIKVENSTYKKIRKLLEITDYEKLSLLMDYNGEIYGIGKMIDNPTCEYYQVRFSGFLKWELLINGEEFLRFENMIPRIPNRNIGISKEDIGCLKKTFNIRTTIKHERIIAEAIKQKHGTMVVFAENAKEEAERLAVSGICVKPTDVSEKSIVESLTSIDGALICDSKGICYAIGTILDGETSAHADSSRGARYNSAIRYVEQQRRKGKKTFAVVVSEDGYVNCFSSGAE
jgi:DNA integrity scanning protein DisA with diadenylate cyclase activity